MTRDEQKDIIAFVENTAKPEVVQELPIDVEADAIIRALFVRNPEAAYRITMLAMAQSVELPKVKSELEDIRQSFRGNWLSRLLKKEDALGRNRRRDPRLAMFPQNMRGR